MTSTPGPTKKPPLHLAVIAFLLAMTPIYSIAYTNLHFSPGDYEAEHFVDPLVYLDMYYGKPAPPEFRYRIITPFLARQIPDFPEWLFSPERLTSPLWQARLHFAVINLVFLLLTVSTLCIFLSDLNFQPIEILLGTFMFLACRPVVQSAALPMVDASAYFFLVMGFLAIKRQNPVWLGLTVLVGAFAKETIFLLTSIVALERDRRAQLRLILAFAPAGVAYLALRVLLQGTGGTLPETPNPYHLMVSLYHPNVLLDLGSSFSSLWLLVAYAFFVCDLPAQLKRWSWFIPLLLAIIFASGSNLGRVLILGFPVVIPLSLLGTRGLLLNTNIGAERPIQD